MTYRNAMLIEHTSNVAYLVNGNWKATGKLVAEEANQGWHGKFYPDADLYTNMPTNFDVYYNGKLVGPAILITEPSYGKRPIVISSNGPFQF